MKNNYNLLKFINLDNLIAFFFAIFIVSLTNSIFINQIGYFGALILLIFKSFKEKKIIFTKNGLEILFVLLLLSEIISTLLSNNISNSFYNLSKRFLIIPVIYVSYSANQNVEQAKKFILLFLLTSIITMIIYLGFSINYFVNNLYSKYDSGPGVFEYPITMSELFSYPLLILFAFLINEKTNRKYKILIIITFLISLLSLIATYKRTGWIGALAGFLAIILLNRKYWIFILGVIALSLILIIQKSYSNLHIYEIKNNNLILHTSIETDGRAINLEKINNTIILADFDKGIKLFKDNKLEKIIETSSPVNKVKFYNDSVIVAFLLNGKLEIFSKKDNIFQKHKEIIPPGFTQNFDIFNNSLFVVDKDSGLTIYDNFLVHHRVLRFYNKKDYYSISIDTNLILLLSEADKLLDVFTSDFKHIQTIDFKSTPLYMINKFNKILISDFDELSLFSFNNNKLEKIFTDYNLKNINHIDFIDENNFIATDLQKNIYLIKILENKFEVIFKNKIDILPTDIAFLDGRIYISNYKINKLISIFDLNNLSNKTRIQLWKAGLKIFSDHPIFGVGDIDLADYYSIYKEPTDKEIFGHMHNNFIHILVTLGISGFIIVMLIFLKIIKMNYIIYNSVKNEPFFGSFALGVSGCFISFLLSGLTEWNFGDQEVITLTWFILGINYFIYSKIERNGN